MVGCGTLLDIADREEKALTTITRTPEQKRAAVAPACSARSYSAVLKHVDRWLTSGWATAEQVDALSSLITDAKDRER